ncbi:hypothetical protein [Actinomadura rifamycini]|uniref:hypothetical protein n=1 Tax=Actinomadura rifamycini TaxID=31962 RepID=UPI0012FBDB91|nr:hypothetical protein [Actinomadura rifamycini]
MDSTSDLCTIEIDRGTIRLKAIEMGLTYGGLIEGAPEPRLNDQIIEDAAEQAARRYRCGPAWVVPPMRSAPEFDDHTGHAYEYLYPVRCTGLFEGPPTPRAGDGWWTSRLVVVWFQQAGDRMVHPDAARAMRPMPWDEMAEDLTFDDW